MASNLLLEPGVIKMQTTAITSANQGTKHDWMNRL
jgi:hypothetical protein